MITFGYKTKMSSILRACTAIGLGLVLVLGTDATVTVVKIIACFLFASGLVSLAYGLSIKKRDGSFQLMLVNTAVDILLGLVLFLNPGWVAGGIIVLIGVALLLFGALQLVVLSTMMSLLGAGFSLLLLSILAILGGVFLIFNPFSVKIMSIAAGTLLVIYGVSELLSTWKVATAKKEYEIRYADEVSAPQSASKQEPESLGDAKEVDFTKVD